MQINLQGQLDYFEQHVNGFVEGTNNDNPFTVWQINMNHQPWCDSSAQACAVLGGGFDGWSDPRVKCQGGAKGDAYCPYTEVHAKALGLWRAKGSGYVPKPGDQPIYDWNFNGVADHIGCRLIQTRADGKHVVGEGNYNNRGQYVLRDDTYIRGWVALSEVASGAVVAPPPAPPVQTPPPQSAAPGFPLPQDHWFGLPNRDARNHSGYWAGDRPHIATFTSKLHARGWNLAPSETFTPAVDGVVRKFQAEKHLTVDGKVGPQTWAAIWNAPVT